MIFNLGVLSYKEATSKQFWDKVAMKIDFTLWMHDVEVALLSIHGVTSDTLPDQDYYAMYRSGDTAEEAALEAVEYAESGEWL